MSSKGNGVNITLSPSERPNDDDTQDAEADEHVQICGTREIPKVYEEVLMVFEKHIPPAKLADYKKHWFCDALWFLFGTEVTPPVSQSFAEAHASRQLWFWLSRQRSSILLRRFHLVMLTINTNRRPVSNVRELPRCKEQSSSTT